MISMNSKISKVRSAWAAGDSIGALRIAARFFDWSEDTRSFQRGMNAYNYPNFYRQLGKDPEQILADALENELGKVFQAARLAVSLQTGDAISATATYRVGPRTAKSA